jgi:hypothetical protein
MLRLEIPMEPDPERQDSDAEERGAERLAQAAEVRRGVVMRCGVCVGGARRERRVEAEELRDCDADAGEGERGAQPREESAF